MTLDEKTVLVFGAGATKAFLPDAPLVEDDYDSELLADKFSAFPDASLVLQQERSRLNNGFINIERLLTRLQGRMPYDSEEASAQLSLLAKELKKRFIHKIIRAKDNQPHKVEIGQLAKICVEKKVMCLTFNYDDSFDEALWNVNSIRGLPKVHKGLMDYWHPDGGYGFFARPSEITIQDADLFMDQTSMLLLKLHGSINWFPKKGERSPYPIDGICHRQSWLHGGDFMAVEPDADVISRHLESDPFLIPPVLDKTALASEPILQTIWDQARDKLRSAKQVIFVGYSLPTTDLAATFLFGEAIGGKANIAHVVNLASTKEDQDCIKMNYRKLFPTMQDSQFEFNGALAWVQRVCGVESTNPD